MIADSEIELDRVLRCRLAVIYHQRFKYHKGPMVREVVTRPTLWHRGRQIRFTSLFSALAVLAIGVLNQAQSAETSVSDAARRCSSLMTLDLGPTKVTKSEILSGDVNYLHASSSRSALSTSNPLSQVALLATPLTNMPAFCRVVLFSSYSTDSTVNSEVWLPLADWNGRFLGTGNGRFAGTIYYGSLAAGLRRGFAAANTDMGTATQTPSEVSVASGHPIKWYDYAFRSTHGMTVAAKAVIEQFYGTGAKYSYFHGCSAGGYQGLRSAQYFPEDYDGIASGNAGNMRAAKVIAQTYYSMQPKLHPQGRLSDAELMLMHKAILKQCAGVGGGLKDDPFLANPPACNWKPRSLLCKGAETDSCLTQEQVGMADRFYAPIVLKTTGETIWPGRPLGTELGWSKDMQDFELRDPSHAAVVRSILGENHDFWKSDWDRDIDIYLRIQGFLWGDGENADLSAFRKRGGKLLSYFGWNDPSSGYDMITYYESVEADLRRRNRLTPAQAAVATREFTRMFMAPGMGHCLGGNGPNSFDPLTPLMKWVEEGVAPESIEAKWEAQTNQLDASFGRSMTRPLCPYPEVAHYAGKGNRDDATNFTCRR